MMGDNRDNSSDSRISSYVGYVPHENLVGPARSFLSFDDRYSMLEFWRWPVAVRYSRLLDRLTDGRRAQAISGRIDYSFADEALLHRALRHASLDVEDDNEHLEFLGDRVLGLVVAEELLARYPQEKEGDLARRQAELVSRRICAEIAAEVNLDAVIRRIRVNEVAATRWRAIFWPMDAKRCWVRVSGWRSAAPQVILALWRAPDANRGTGRCQNRIARMGHETKTRHARL